MVGQFEIALEPGELVLSDGLGSAAMATAWEYIRVSVSARATTPHGAKGGQAFNDAYQKAVAEATDSWIAKLNERGATGWELVSERFAAGGAGRSTDPYWAEYGGTMKRPGSPL